MKLLFKNTTIYDLKNYSEFIQFHGKKFSFSYNTYTIVMSILLLYCIIMNVMEKNLVLFLVFIVMLLLWILFRIYLPIKRHGKTKKKYAKNKQNNYTFTFYKYYFVVDQKIIPYWKLYKVFETNDYFYLYVNEQNAILVSKTGFTLGTNEDFTNFIKKKCLFKYSKEL